MKQAAMWDRPTWQRTEGKLQSKQGGAKALHSIAHESPGDNCVNDPGSSSSQQSLGMTLDKLLRDQELLSHQALGGSAGK